MVARENLVIPDFGPAEVVVNEQRYVRETTLFAAMEAGDEARQLVHRLDETIHDLEEALTWADDYLGSLDDEGARVVRRKIQDAWPKWVDASRPDPDEPSDGRDLKGGILP
jgi:hypothetical protein